ncbi:putative porin [Maribacter arenosus]|uniref:Porin n=1 Tax=Maribacter arenosus TaxID=1854708 RepID=A0ABR7VG02_9FLAO|nr:putative porin [Maribacter arenosus]MBD0852564.1 putative porin [Maribacter arenosus]
MKYVFLLLFVFCCPLLNAQVDSIPSRKKIDSTRFKMMAKKKLPSEAVQEITIKDYKIISFERDTTYLDTTLTIQKEYKYNYLRKDDFELIPFANVGQPYNKLGVDFERRQMFPRLGARAKHDNYFEVEDIDYYNVATPMSDLFFKTTFEQGQLLDALLTLNTSKRFNVSLAFKGFRSLGKYQLNQAESGNFRSTANYVTENGRYSLRSHIAAQDVETEENGGLISKVEQFESGDPDFTDRSRVDTRFSSSDMGENKILGKRYFLEHQYKMLRTQKDSSMVEKTSLAIGHIFNYETKYYQFKQDASNEYFGATFDSPINDKAHLKTMYNEFYAEFYNATLGRLQGNISLYNYNYYFNSLLVTANGQQIQSQLKGDEISLGAKYSKHIGGFLVKGDAKYNLSGDLTSNILDASASYRFNENNNVEFSLHSSARMPDFNFLLYQSDYENYNWQNTSNFENQKVNSLQFQLFSKKWGNLSAKYSSIDNYTYFSEDPTQELVENQEQATIRPFQETNSVGYIKVKYNKEFKLGGFALNNTVMYQNVSQSNEVLNVPQLVTRNTLYFSSDVFKKAMYLQTGITFKYFTSYTMDAYNPLLGEFYSQNTEKLGGFPMLDFFINARVQQTRIYLKAEHFNSSFSGYNFYAAPNYPYRDFVIRFGLVWNFFS